MSIFNKFKKESEAEKKPQAAVQKERLAKAVKAEPKPKTIREELADRATVTASTKGATKGVYAHRMLLRPVISEKSAMLHGMNQYVFEVSPLANKVSIKKAIFEAYHVQPLSIRIASFHGKKITRGKVRGTTAGYKKAIVIMPKGSELPIYEGV